jgi:hypothetical protein
VIAMGAEGELAREVGAPGLAEGEGRRRESNPPERRREAPFCETQGDETLVEKEASKGK